LPGEESVSAGALDGVNTFAVRHRVLGSAFWMPAMWQAAGDDRYDVAVFGWNVRYPHLPVAMERARRRGIGVVLWGHGYSLVEGRVRRGFRNFLARRADAVVTYNRRAARALLDAGGAADRIFVAPNALGGDAIETATRAWSEEPGRLAKFREDLGLNGDPIALHVSRLGSIANLRVLLDTWRCIVSIVPRARLVIVGDGPARNALVSDIARVGLRDSVRCVGAVFGEESIAPYFLSARLLLHPMKIGLSLNHAMGYGVPVVAFDDPGRHSPEFEALEHGSNGMVAAHGDVRELAVNAAQLLLDADLAARLGRQARHAMRARYSLDAMVDGFLDAVRRADASRSR
jgi:glycosyltransferase involved in cell wall biosynthesis